MAKHIRTKMSLDQAPFLFRAPHFIPGVSTENMFGKNPAVAGSSTEDVWGNGGAYNFLTSASNLEILSSDTADTSSGTGAQTVKVFGLDQNYNEQNEVIALDGTTPVDLVNQYIRINKLHVVTAGSTGSNQGIITLRVQPGGAVVGTIETTNNASLMAVYTTPINKIGLILQISGDIDNHNITADLELILKVRPFGEVFQYRYNIGLNDSGSSHVSHDLICPIFVPTRSDIIMSAVNSSILSLDVSGNLDLVLIEV